MGRKNKKNVIQPMEVKFGGKLEKPKEIVPLNSIRLYTKDELKDILQERDMEIIKTFSNYYGKPDSEKNENIFMMKTIINGCFANVELFILGG